MELAYRLCDADNHYYEAEDCYTRHIEPEFRARTLQLVEQRDGSRKPMVDGREYTYLPNPFLHFGRPGQMKEFTELAKDGSLDPEVATERFVEYVDPRARVELLDKQGVEKALIFPSLHITTQPVFAHDVRLLNASMRAFNRWLLDDWKFDYEGRLFSAPCINLHDPAAAVAELDWVLANGARIIDIDPGPHGGKSPADLSLDAFWARVQEAGLLVALHSSDSGYVRALSGMWGENPSPPVFEQSLWQWVCCWQPRAVTDTIVSMVHYNLFGRFPGLRILSIENGGDFLPSLCYNIDRAAVWSYSGPWPGGRLKDKPSEIIRRHVWVSPWPDEDLDAIVRCMGAEHVLFGSDYPHPEGCREPREFADSLAGMPATTVRKIMRDNLEGLLKGGGLH
jgi:predicted TIM-barrel fold metal-dependent hydrolase